MAGICGYINKRPGYFTIGEDSHNSMLEFLGENQPTKTFISTNKSVFLGEKQQERNSKIEKNEKMIFQNLEIVSEGLVFFDKSAEEYVSDKYQILPQASTLNLISAFFVEYGYGILNHISGHFNIAIYDKNIEQLIIFNDKFGFLPLYIFENENAFVFSSKIDSILKSGIMLNLEIDEVSVLEHLLFNYIISDNTFVKEVHTLAPAQTLSIRNNKSTIDTYWDFDTLLSFNKPLSKKDSFEEMNLGLYNAIEKVVNKTSETINFTLTGGWDSRVLLSYLMKHRDRLNLFSFGAPESYDIEIPKLISKSLNISYSPFILDDNYLKNNFLEASKKTIINSNGTRNYKRSHYIFANQEMGKKSSIVINGIFGDEVLKIAGPSAGNVVTKNIIDYISSGFNVSTLELAIEQNVIANKFLENSTIDELSARMGILKNGIDSRDSARNFYRFRFTQNLRKYFGQEANSYNDHVLTYSPFVDIEFLTSYFRGHFCGIYYPFNSGSLKLKFETTKLYSDLVIRNFEPLIGYPTNRGYTMKDSRSICGNLKIYIKNIHRGKKNQDEFNTAKTDEIFGSFLNGTSETIHKNKYSALLEGGTKELSLYYWINKVMHT